MSRLDELIAELCPDGVEYRTLGEVCSFKYGYTASAADTGNARFVRITDIGEDGLLKSTSPKYVDIEEDNREYMLSEGDILVARTGATFGKTLLVRTDSPAIYASYLMRLCFDQKKVLNSFYWHYAKSAMYWEQAVKLVQGGGQPQFNANVMKRIRIPVPPLEIQREIVRILDNFTALAAALAEELQARKKQYEYYRDLLLSYDEEGNPRMAGGQKAVWMTLGDVCGVTKLAGFEFTEHVRYVDEGEIIALRALNIKKGLLDLTNVRFIDGSNFTKLSRSKLYINDLLFTYVGTVGEVALVDANDRYYLAPNVARIRFATERVSPEFMRHYFQCSEFIVNQIGKYMESSSMKNLSMENIRKFLIPIPPLAEQERIVAILDRFDALVNDISSGLPAEIEARRKQYEYYRDQLLTFQEKQG